MSFDEDYSINIIVADPLWDYDRRSNKIYEILEASKHSYTCIYCKNAYLRTNDDKLIGVGGHYRDIYGQNVQLPFYVCLDCVSSSHYVSDLILNKKIYVITEKRSYDIIVKQIMNIRRLLQVI